MALISLKTSHLLSFLPFLPLLPLPSSLHFRRGPGASRHFPAASPFPRFHAVSRLCFLVHVGGAFGSSRSLHTGAPKMNSHTDLFAGDWKQELQMAVRIAKLETSLQYERKDSLRDKGLLTGRGVLEFALNWFTRRDICKGTLTRRELVKVSTMTRRRSIQMHGSCSSAMKRCVVCTQTQDSPRRR